MKHFKIIIVIIIGLSLFGFFYWTNWTAIIEQLTAFKSGFLWLLLISFFGYVLGAVSWNFCFRSKHDSSFYHLFYARTLGENITLINPTNIIAGEASKMQVLNINVSDEEKLESIVISRVIMIITQLSLSLFCFIYLTRHLQLGSKPYLLLMIIVSVFAVGFYILKKMIGLSSNIKYIELLLTKLKHFTAAFISFFKAYKSKAFLAILFASFHWTCGALEFYCILNYLNVDLGLMLCLSIDMGIVIIKSLAGFIPGQIGVEEIGNKLLLEMTGVSSALIWMTVSILRRAKQVFWLVVCALVFSISRLFINTKKTNHGSIVYHS